MTTNDLRKKYIEFFQSRDHAVIASASLLPDNDPTTLFTGSGMQPIIPYLLGEAHPSGTRLVNSQKCFRSQDIDEVGDNRHTTFFEMLGNWSLGDYFKTDQILWLFEFVTKEIGLDPKRIYITCFRGQEDIGIPKDEEASALWKKQFDTVGVDAEIIDFTERDGMQGGRIFYYDAGKNWWSRAGRPEKMPVGEPGGPDTEMFWDFGVHLGLHEQSQWKDEPCHVNCDCGRFFEIGNSVFMEFQKTESGFVPLKQKNVDFGGGLERMAASMIDSPDVFMTDLFLGQKNVLQEISGKTYGENEKETKAFRVILDHLRVATFLISDGAFPSNKDQGYFTRRFVRRAVRFAKTLGIEGHFCGQVAEAVIEEYKDAYPNLVEKSDYILSELEKEETKFRRTIDIGTKKFSDLAEQTISNQQSAISGVDAFDLYQSFGFPVELTVELAEEQGLTVDVETFEIEKHKHIDLSRKGSEQKFHGGLADHSEQCIKYHTATHLLHAACLKVLGSHATQKGSNITQERMRFDFAHSEKLTPEQIQTLEDLVNGAIARDYPVSFDFMTVDEAKAKGAIGLFEESYGEKVKVYTVGDVNAPADADPTGATFSREFCGGPHVERTGVLGHFKIIKEESVGAGLRRIKAVLEE